MNLTEENSKEGSVVARFRKERKKDEEEEEREREKEMR